MIPLITQTVFPESFNSTYLTLHFSVRARALGSFLSAVVCIIGGNLFGLLLDSRWSLKKRARYGWAIAAVVLQGAWWIWSVVINEEYRKIGPTSVYDWSDPGFGRGFGSYLAVALGFQLNYLFLYFICGSLVSKPADLLRIGGLLRATESAVSLFLSLAASLPIADTAIDRPKLSRMASTRSNLSRASAQRP